MATVAETVAIVAPQYATDPRLTAAIDLAQTQISPTYWTNLYTAGSAYLAAHILAIADRGVAAGTNPTMGAGPVSSVHEGQAGIGYAQAAGLNGASLADAYLTTTQYGLSFLGLQKQLGAGVTAWMR